MLIAVYRGNEWYCTGDRTWKVIQHLESNGLFIKEQADLHVVYDLLNGRADQKESKLNWGKLSKHSDKFTELTGKYSALKYFM